MDESAVRREAFWKMYQEHCTHIRHHDVQRSTVAASLIAITGAMLAVATFDRSLSRSDLPLLLMVSALGVFGALFSAKHYERSAMHMERARAYRDAIDAELTAQPIKKLKVGADERHNEEFPRLHKLRINRFWLLLYVFISLLGVTLAVTALFFSSPEPS